MFVLWGSTVQGFIGLCVWLRRVSYK